ncbi:MAG: cellulose binding domain-containing protein [Myxococcales bacterium]
MRKSSVLVLSVLAVAGCDQKDSASIRRSLSVSPVPTSLAVVPTTIAVDQTATGTVTLSEPAPAGGSVVTLFAMNLDSPQVPAVTIPATFTIPEGAQVGSFLITPTPFGGAFHVNMRAQVNGVAVSTTGIESLVILRTLPAGNAILVSGTPRCGAVGAFCDTGGLIDSRGALFLASESNAPNTINGSCQDGFGGIGFPPNRGVYHFDQSLDRLRVSTLDGSALAAGKTVKIEATVWSAGRLDLYSAPDATSPVWTLILSTQVTSPLPRPNVVTTTFTLPAGTLQAIRGNFGTPRNPPTPCAIDQSSVIDDHDDLVFATDNGGPPTNTAPVVNAGADQAITLPPVATLQGAATDDGLPTPPAAFTMTWSKVSGPGAVTFADVGAALTTATFSLAGTYTLQLTASDGVLSTSDALVVDVNTGGAANQAPVVNAGPDQTITLPGVADLTAAVTDDGKPNPPGSFTISWSKITGPGVVSFANSTSATTTATFGAPGTYTLRCTANDALLSSSDDIVVIINPVPNQAPTIDAGPDQEVFVTSGALLSGTASDDGLPNPPGVLTVVWSQVSGPGTVVFSSASALATAADFSAPGTYVLRLTVTDGASARNDDMTVIVNPPLNQAPLVNAGLDQTITLPATANLIGEVMDDRFPAPPAAFSVVWSRVGGPGTVTFANANALLTSATFSVAGTYTLRLTADDSALATSDDLVVTVNAAPVNTAPVVGAGADQIITLPASAALAGTATDDGLPGPGTLNATWSKVSGPGTVTFANPTALVTSATFSTAGSYLLRLLASDGALSTTDSVAVTVNPVPTLKVQYRAVAPSPGDNQIRASLNIVNGGGTSIPLRELKIRYWYTVDTSRAQTVHCDFAQVGCSRITGQFVTVSPARPGADRYLEVGFTNTAGNLAPGARTGEIQGRVQKTDFSNYNEANDYSYTTSSGVPAPTSLVDWTRVTLYRNGVKVWGTEP